MLILKWQKCKHERLKWNFHTEWQTCFYEIHFVEIITHKYSKWLIFFCALIHVNSSDCVFLDPMKPYLWYHVWYEIYNTLHHTLLTTTKNTAIIHANLLFSFCSATIVVQTCKSCKNLKYTIVHSMFLDLSWAVPNNLRHSFPMGE